VDQLQIVNGIEEVSELESIVFQDGYDEVRREIKHLLATIKAMVALLPRSEG
jgi:hypothetical protein